MVKKESRYVQALLFTAVFFMIVIIVNNVLSVGQRLGQVHWSVEMTFYVISTGLAFYLVVFPVVKIVRIPHAKISDFMEDHAVIDEKAIKKHIQRMQASKFLDPVDKEHLAKALGSDNEIEVIREIYIDKVADIEKEIEDTAILVLMTTAVSQNGVVDAISIIYYNIRMIKNIVHIVGFRPALKQMGKMIRDIFVAAFIFNTIEEINPEEMLEDILDASGEKLFGTIVSKVSSSFIQGCLSAYVTLKIGYVTKYWLYMSEKDFDEKNIKKQSRSEARKVLVSKVIKRTVGSIPKQAVQMAGRLFDRKKR